MLKSPIPLESWAEVRAGDRVIRYARLGSGLTILLLAHNDTPLRDELLHALASNFRVLAPDLSSADTTSARCLATFLDGLGARSLGLVAAGELCVPALELALRDGDQIGRVVLVPEGTSADWVSEGALAAAPRNGSMPLLIACAALATTEELPAVLHFLSGTD